MDDEDKLDANLVLALDALLQERSVSRAAERIGVRQPAMSHGLERRVAVLLPSFVAAMNVVAGSDLVLTVPRRLAERLPDRLRVLPTPVPVPSYEVQQIWHERDHHDAAHRWLRATIVAAL